MNRALMGIPEGTLTVAVTMVKDEADIIETTLRHMATQVTSIIVADNMSTDGTRAILDRLANEIRLEVVDDLDPAYRQSEKMTALALRARLAHGAEWIVPFDADEIWYSPFGRIGDILAGVAEQWLVMPARLYDHVATGVDNQDEPDPVRRLGWRRDYPAPLPKVACRWREDLIIGMGNHDATYRGGATTHDSQLVIRHFPYRSAEQLIRKVANGARAYSATDLPAQYGAHWRQWGQILDQSGPDAIVELFNTWYRHEDPTNPKVVDGEQLSALVYDPAPVSR